MATSDSSIRQFQVEVPEAELAELRRRVSATRWPECETVTDDSQGVRLAMMQELARSLIPPRMARARRMRSIW